MKKVAMVVMQVITATTLVAGTSEEHLSQLKKIDKVRGNRVQAEQLHQKALGEHNKKHYAAAEKLWYTTALKDPSWGKIYYNLACATAMQGKKSIAIEYLGIALGLDGHNLIVFVRSDSDLRSLKEMPAYRELYINYILRNKGLVLSEDSIEILRYILTSKNLPLFKSIIHEKSGLTIDYEGEKRTHVQYSAITKKLFDNVVDRFYDDNDQYEFAVVSCAEYDNCGSDAINEQQTLHRITHFSTTYSDPQSEYQGPPSDSYLDVCFIFKKIQSRWFLYKITGSGNGGV